MASNMPAYHPNVPKQNNGTDCGLFLLENVEGFLTRPSFVLSDLS
jgi:Ulp1 family protease